jgi:glycosyltransferase involved in cell wall biosynthesis
MTPNDVPALATSPSASHPETRRASLGPRISLLLPALEGGGAERVMLTLARELRARHYDVELVIGHMRGNLRSEVPHDVPIVDLGRPHLRTAVVPLIRHLGRRRPACLLSTLDHANVLAIWSARVASTRTAVIARQANLLSTSGRASRTAPITLALAKRTYRRAPRLVAVTEAVAHELVSLAGVQRERIRVIPNPVISPDLELLRSEPLHEPWFAPSEPPVVLGVGRLTPQKNFGGLIRAFALLRRKREARLVILGEGPERSSLSDLSTEQGVAGDVAFLGFKPNPYKYMARSAVFAMSSDWEGLPGALIQALASGTSVVATDCPTGPREILRDGRHGLLVPVGNVGSLAEALALRLEEPVPSAPPEAWQRYTTDSAVTGYISVIEELIS